MLAMPISRAALSACTTLGERPEVVMAKSTSPLRPSPRSGRAKISSYPKSLPSAVSVEGSSASESAGHEGRATRERKRTKSSAARCWASAAEPPLPQKSNLPPARKRVSQRSTAARTESAKLSASRRLSSAERSIIAVKRRRSASRRAFSVAIELMLEGPIDRHADVSGLFRRELAERSADFRKMQRGNLFVQLLRQSINAALVFAGRRIEKLDLPRLGWK